VARTPAAIVVDQDVQARYEMKQVVKASGLSVAAESGYGIEAMTAASETRPDVIVVACNEPMERPLQTIESLLTMLLPETPVIVYSDSHDIQAVRKVMLAGARDYLPRPVKPETLRESALKSMEAEENRRLRKSGRMEMAPSVGTVITVFGAKGGIGKSTLSTNLAVALARQGASTVIVDLDNGFGDVTGMLDIRPERTLADFARDIETAERDDLKRYLSRHEISGLDVLAAPPILQWRTVAVEDVRRCVALLAKHYDKVVIDTSGTLNEISEMAMSVATMALWVTTTEYASVRDSIEAMRALQTLSFPSERMRIVLNSTTPDDNVRAATVQDVLKRPVFWQIPYDKRIRQGTHLGQPLVVTSPTSVAAKSFVDLATVISGGRVEPQKSASGGMKWLPTRPAVAEGNRPAVAEGN
jgi:pilus assembly protein CpaE